MRASKLVSTVTATLVSLAFLSVAPQAHAALEPATPSGLAVVHDDATGSATLSWSPPGQDGGSPVLGYRVGRDGVDRQGGAAWSTTLPATARRQVFTSLRPGDTYRLSVQALNAAGTGPAATATVSLAAGVPGPVRDLDTGRFGPVEWSPPAFDGGSPVTGYRVSRDGVDGSGRGPTSVVVPATATRYLFPTLEPGRRYHVTVTPINAVGDGEPTTGAHQEVPEPPGGLTLRVTQHPRTHSATVHWSAPDDRGAPMESYELTWRNVDEDTDSGTAVLTGQTRQFTLGPLHQASTYEVDVVGSNDSDAGGGGTITFTAPEPPGPVAAPRTSLSATGRELLVHWAAPASDGRTPVTGYRVKTIARETAGLTWTERFVGASYRSLRLPTRPSTSYEVRVQAVNAWGWGFGDSSWRSPVVTPPRPPGAPRTLAVATDAAAQLLTVTWTAPTRTGGSPVTGYRVVLRKPGGRTATLQPAAEARTASFVDLVVGQAYTVTVRAVTAAGPGRTARSRVILR